MTSRSDRDFLKIQLLETERMLQLVGDHPIMSQSLKEKAEDLELALNNIPLDQKESKISLFFTGKPVYGSMGIDASFAGKVLVPFQNMVTSEFASQNGKVGKRGPLSNKVESRLFLTSLPRGSFGVELSKLTSEDLFEENQMADVLSHLTKLVESSAKSDEDFASELDGFTPRTIQALEEFFKIVHEDEAGVSIESGGIRCELNPTEVKKAFDRVSETKLAEDTVKVEGKFRGILAESWRFDFLTLKGEKISGKVDEELTEDKVKEYLMQFYDQDCIAVVKEGRVVFKNGSERKSYTLISLEPQASN